MEPDAGGTPPWRLSAVPAQRKDAAPDGAAGSTGGRPPAKRRTRYTARAAVLLLVFCALVLALAYPLQQYVSQGSQLDRIQRQNDQKTKEVAQLKQQLQDWQDPAFVEIQARQRLHFVMPGETGLRLLGPAGGTDSENGVLNPGSADSAWYGQLWNSVTAAATP
jgi:cell division protein FtsB